MFRPEVVERVEQVEQVVVYGLPSIVEYQVVSLKMHI